MFHEDRARCYWAGFRIRQLGSFSKSDPSTDVGKQFHNLLGADPILKKIKFPKPDHSRERDSLKTLLSRPDYKTIWDKYLEAKRNKRPTHWYGLCSDAKSLRDLARLISKEAHYALFYQQLSDITHGSDVFSDVLSTSKQEGVKIHQLRGPESKLKVVANLTANYLLLSHHLLIDTYFKGEKEVTDTYRTWYLDYRDFFLWLTGAQGKK